MKPKIKTTLGTPQRLKTQCLLTVATIFALAACHAPQPPGPAITFLAPEAPQTLSLPSSDPAHSFAVSPGPGGNIRLALQWSKPDPNFQTQLACTINSHLDHFKLYLLRAETPLGSIVPLSLGTLLNPYEGPFNIGKKSLTSPSGSETFTFNNVPEGKYYVAMSAHNASDLNITGTGAGSSTGLVGLSLVSVSNGGGNAGSPGRVEIGPAPSFAILNGTEATLTLNLKLSSLLCL